MQSPSQHCVPLPVGYMSNSSSCTTPETQQIDGTPGCHPVSQVPIWPLQSLRSPWIFQEDLELPPWEHLQERGQEVRRSSALLEASIVSPCVGRCQLHIVLRSYFLDVEKAAGKHCSGCMFKSLR